MVKGVLHSFDVKRMIGSMMIYMNRIHGCKTHGSTKD